MNLKRNILIYIYYFILIIYSCYSNEVYDENVSIDKLLIENNEINNAIENILLNFAKSDTKIKNLNELRKKEELHTALWNFIFKSNNYLDYKNLLINKSDFLSIKNFESPNKNKEILSILHQNLYPWLYGYHYKSLNDIISSSKGKGIIICNTNKNFYSVINIVDTFKNVLNTTLPIEIFYNGENDLSLKNRKILSQYKNIYLSDISKYFDNNIIKINHFAIKPFSILASRFEEIILINADSFFIKDPSVLFNDIGYLEKGTLFFRDRIQIYSEKKLKWLKSFIFNPLPETKKSNVWNKRSAEEIDSSVVVIHKTKSFLGLLNICKLNEKKLRDKIIYKYVHGDKETFWIGFEMSRQNYNVIPSPCAIIGKIEKIKDKNNKEVEKFCGNTNRIAHTLRNKELIFWNDHIIEKEEEDIYNNDKYEAYYIDDSYDINSYCFILKNRKELIYFNEKEQQILKMILERRKKE